MNVNDLLNSMADLDAKQLEKIKQFIDGRAYKIEGRPPTHRECQETLLEIRKYLSDAPPPEENLGLTRLKELGFIKD